MSGKARDIVRRIKAIKNTQQITKAMQLVAASKMKRAQDSAKQLRDYSLLLADILQLLVDRAREIEHPLLEERKESKRCILMISTDKGLCGALNSNLFRMLPKAEESVAYVSIGRKAKQFLARTHRELLADFTVSDKVNFSEVRMAVEFILQAYMDGQVDTIEVLYPQFINTLVQTPAMQKLAPLISLDEEIMSLRKRLGITEEATASHTQEASMLFEPSAEAMLSQLPEMFIKQEIYQMVLESKASEHSARMVAMKNATDNANNLAKDLTLLYNRARQAGITQEILELSAASTS